MSLNHRLYLEGEEERDANRRCQEPFRRMSDWELCGVCAGRAGEWVEESVLREMKHCLVSSRCPGSDPRPYVFRDAEGRPSGVQAGVTLRPALVCAGRVGDGGKWVCGMRMLQEMKHCLVYSLGSQGDTSFEDEFLDRTICEVCRPPHPILE